MSTGNGAAEVELLELSGRVSVIERAQSRHAHEWSVLTAELKDVKEILRGTSSFASDIHTKVVDPETGLAKLHEKIDRLLLAIPTIARREIERAARALDGKRSARRQRKGRSR